VKGDPLPSTDHVLRHCRKGDLKWDYPGGTIRGVFPDAFEPDADGISVTWLEYFGGNSDDQLTAAREAMDRGRKLRLSNRLARLNVGAIVEAGTRVRKAVVVTHDPIDEPPEKENKGHSLIEGVATDDDDLRNRLANIVLASHLEPAKL
jgi:hypothetical protein